MIRARRGMRWCPRCLSAMAVYDVMTRYEGSRWNRTNGIGFDITKTTINPRADRPANTILSWKVDFPNYAQFEGKRGKMVLKAQSSVPWTG